MKPRHVVSSIAGSPCFRSVSSDSAVIGSAKIPQSFNLTGFPDASPHPKFNVTLEMRMLGSCFGNFINANIAL